MLRVSTTSVWPTATTVMIATLEAMRLKVPVGVVAVDQRAEDQDRHDDEQEQAELPNLLRPDVPLQPVHAASSLDVR